MQFKDKDIGLTRKCWPFSFLIILFDFNESLFDVFYFKPLTFFFYDGIIRIDNNSSMRRNIMTQEHFFGNAKWVGAINRTAESFSVLRGDFYVDSPKRVVLNILGLGFFKCYINGVCVNPDTFLPLSSDYEALPLALLEAMAAGLPIVSTDVGGVRDIVTDNGILTSAGDLTDMVQAMEKLYLDLELRSLMAVASRKNVRAYDVSNTVAGYSELYCRYANKK
jgi:hypothetical protein